MRAATRPRSRAGIAPITVVRSPNAKVNFNADYLIEALEAVEADEVILSLRDREPAVLRLPNESWLCVTMFYGTADAKATEEAPKSPAKK